MRIFTSVSRTWTSCTIPAAVNLILKLRPMLPSLLDQDIKSSTDTEVAVARINLATMEIKLRTAIPIKRERGIATIVANPDIGPENVAAASGMDYAGDRNDRRSTSGYAAFLGESLISWAAQKQEVVSLSSTEAEYIAVAYGAREGMWLRAFLKELGLPQGPTPVFADNTSAIRLVENPEFHKRTKHIDVKYHFVRELNESNQISTRYVSTNEQRADIFTKPLGRAKFVENRSRLGMIEAPHAQIEGEIEGESEGEIDPNNKNPEPPEPASPLHAHLSVEDNERANTGNERGPRQSRKLGMLNWLLVMFLIVTSPSDAVHITSSRPILWRKSKIPIISGYEKVFVKLQLISPCILINASMMHYETLQDARRMCEEAYQNKFLKELEKMCPASKRKEPDQVNKRKPRSKRVRRLVLIIAIIVVGLVMAGAAVGDFLLSVSNSRRLGQAEDVILAQDREMEVLNKETNLTEVALPKLRRDFNQ